MQPTLKIGIIGGGQLGKMLCEAAIKLGFAVIVLDPTPNSPAAQSGAQQIVDNYTEKAIEKLAKQVDFMTVEFEEGLELNVLKRLAKSGSKINPEPSTIGLILDKLNQKDYLSQRQIAIGPYQVINDKSDAHRLLDEFGGKMVIKTRRGGYDGYGNRVVDSQKSIDKALQDFSGKPVYAEAFVNFKKELAVMVARSLNGEIKLYPVVETIQKDNICHEVLAPADIDKLVQNRAKAMAEKVALSFSGAGMFGIEMFLTEDNQLVLNEVAPRVHNSGHYTIEACKTSQFEQHIRAITDMPLGPTDMVVPAAAMINILGTRSGPAEPKGLEEVESYPHTKVHIYGKAQTKVGRKMGHITVTGEDIATVRQIAEKARAALNI